MVDLTDPETLAAVVNMQRKDIPELRDLDAIMLAELPKTCRLDIPLRTRLDFQKMSPYLGMLQGRLTEIGHNERLTTLQALREARAEVDKINRIFRELCPATKSGSGR